MATSPTPAPPSAYFSAAAQAFNSLLQNAVQRKQAATAQAEEESQAEYRQRQANVAEEEIKGRNAYQQALIKLQPQMHNVQAIAAAQSAQHEALTTGTPIPGAQVVSTQPTTATGAPGPANM